MSDEDLEQCAIDIDADGSGTITFEEFSTWFLTGKEGTPEEGGDILNSLKDKAQLIGNQFIKELVKVPKLEKKDMHSAKFEVFTKKFESKSAATSLSAQFGIASNTHEPIMSQRKEMNLESTNKNSHVFIKFKLNQPSDDISRVVEKFKQLKIVKAIS